MTDQESLVGKLFKARYYPNGSFLIAKLGNNPSYIWRSILESQVLFKQRTVHRIGCGRSIDIMTDLWIPNSDIHYVQMVHEALEGKSVSMLMVTGQKERDVDLL